MANEQDEVNANGWNGSDASSHNNSGKAAGSGNTGKSKEKVEKFSIVI